MNNRRKSGWKRGTFNMNSTERVPARSFVSELLLPLKRANMRKNILYLNCDARKSTHWEPVLSRTGGMERLSLINSSGPALLASLEQYWRKNNDVNLPKLLPYLLALRQQILETGEVENEKGPRLSEFVYPLF